MLILAHRGLWSADVPKNSEVSFIRALENGFGLETDLRDLSAKIVVSHDMADGDCVTVERLLDLVAELSPDAPLALNIKADGLSAELCALLKKYDIRNHFFFDMSVPDMLSYVSREMPVFTRLSDYEPDPVLKEKAFGVWLDAFESEWYLKKSLSEIIAIYSKVAFVSPELHGRAHAPTWVWLAKELRTLEKGRENVMLCTDFPLEAKNYMLSEGVYEQD